MCVRLTVVIGHGRRVKVMIDAHVIDSDGGGRGSGGGGERRCLEGLRRRRKAREVRVGNRLREAKISKNNTRPTTQHTFIRENPVDTASK